MSEHHHHDPFKPHSPEFGQLKQNWDRRNFLIKTSMGIGAMALGSLLGNGLFGKTGSAKATAGTAEENLEAEILGAIPHFAPRAKRVVYLFMAGGPSQLETFDYKPKLVNMFGQPLPDSVRQGQRLTSMSANQSILPLVPSVFKIQPARCFANLGERVVATYSRSSG